ncbi:MAG: PAS domain S-box protein [Promethearchaeota archaeon]|jgi:PAS domain S-box-containing protein
MGKLHTDIKPYHKHTLFNPTHNEDLEKNVREFKENYLVLFNNSTSGIAYHKILYSSNGKPINYLITDVNPQYESILSIKKEDAINKTATEVYNVAEPPYIDIYSNVAETQKSHSFETYYHPMDLYFKVSAISHRKGEFITVFDDISERKRSEQKLKESERSLRESEVRFRSLVEATSDWIWEIDKNGYFTYSSPKIKDLLGYDPQEIIGRTPFDYMAIDQFQELKETYLNLFKSKKPYSGLINKCKHKNGKTVSLETSGVPIFNENDEFIGYHGIDRDITDRIKSNQRIKESEEKFRTIAEQSFMGIVIVQNGEIKYINEAMSTISGYPVGDMLNWTEKNYSKMIFPEDLSQILARVRSNKEEKMGIFSNNSFRIVNKNGEVRWLEDFTRKIIYQGKAANLISIIDVTDKIKAEKLILEENRKLIELNKMRKDIITRVSHELKTPLTSIYGASQILLKHLNIKIDDEALKFIEIFHRGALRLKKLVENLIDASRIEYGKLELKIQTHDLVGIIKECIEEMRYLMDNRNIILISDLPIKLEASVDKIRLQQVITNILSNAIKNTAINGNIYVNLVHNLEYTDLQIRDTGIGLIEKEKELLFEKFGKIERYGMDLGVDIEGSGLGLYISKEIIELHGGQILVESEGRNKGALFTVRLFRNL